MKQILSLIIAILFLLQGFAAFGDVVFAPESDFYESHRTACSHLGGDFYSNGEKGYIALYKKPDGTLIDYLRNAQKIHIFCTYENWGMISSINGNSQVTGKWVKMSDLYRIYDDSSFCEEFSDKIIQSNEALTLPAEVEEIFIYQYPGAKNPDKFGSNLTEIRSYSRYVDAEGRIWGRVGYFQGIRGEWICFSNPDKVIEPFGGDPNIEKFEKYSANIQLPEAEPEPDVPDTEKDDTVVSTPESGNVDNDEVYEIEDTLLESATNQVFLPEEPPLRIPMNPLLIVSIVLVAAAVIAAVVLIIVCYKRKEQ